MRGPESRFRYADDAELSGPICVIRPRRFRCHTGHSYTPGALIEVHRELAEKTLGVLTTLFEDEVFLSAHLLSTSKDSQKIEQFGVT